MWALKAPDAIQLLIAAVAFMALIISAHAEWRLRQLGTLQFPGVVATWTAQHKAGPRDGAPPLETDTHEIALRLTDREDSFSIADARLVFWDDYWVRYSLRKQLDNYETVYVSRLKDGRSPVPPFLKVRVERRGGIQAACWHKVRIEGTPS